MRLRVRGRRAGPLGRTLAAMAVSSCFAAPAALANPTGANVVRGTAAIHQAGNLLQITNSPNAIINWQTFSIGANEITRFIQQSSSSAVLNRVTSQNPSTILGALQSNGRVFLINPNGILFGAGAQVDVAGLVASTLNMSDQDFLAGRLRFADGLGKSVVNDGSIATSTGGSVYLIGSGVTNNGIIRSPRGEVVLAAGNSVELVNPATPSLRVEVVATDNAARNLGQIVADAGRVGIYAGLVGQSGTVRADSAVAEGGRIVLKATKNVTVAAGSVTSASGATGGLITVQSGDTTLVAGSVEATGVGSPPAGGGVAPAGDRVVGEGGTVEVLGNLVGVIGSASIDVSGNTGGGTVLVGGDFQGQNPGVQNAYRTYLGPDAVIRADAGTTGDGGKVIVWSDDATRAYGTISARGGVASGDGGFVEVSGKSYLDFDASVNVGARAGRAGTLLLDPQDITISNTTTTNDNQLNSGVPTGGDAAGSVFFADGNGGNFTISDEALEAQTGNIVLQASRDITVNNNLSGGLDLVNQGAGERVVLQAGRDITIGSPITTAGAAIILEADSVHSSSSAANGSGTLTINAAVTSNGGHITLIGGGNPILSGGGIALSENQTIDAGAGGIDIALSGNASLGVGTLGLLTQILGNPMDELHTTGPLRVGMATTAGSDGLGAGAQPLLANSVTNIFPGSAIDLSPATGSTFELHAGSGGIVLDQPLTTFQGTAINTSGTLAINDPVNTSNNNLSITAANVTFGANGSINTGTASCSGPGCPVSTRFWDGGGGVDKSWFNALNWSGDAVPTLGDDVRIDTGFGTILISGDDALAKSLLANSALEISSTGSLSLANASQFTQQFTLAGGSLLGSGSAAVTGSSGSLTWSGGTMGSGGSFLLGSASSGTLSNALTLHRLFESQGALTLSGATVGGTGSIANSGTLTAALGTSNTINTPLANVINTTLGTIQVNGMLAATNFPTNAGVISIGSVGMLSTGNASLTNEVGATIQAAAGGTLNLGANGSFTNSGTAVFGGSYNAAATNVDAGTVMLNGTANTGTLNLSGGTVTGVGDLAVATDYNQTGGTLGTAFGDLVLNRSGDFIVGAAGIAARDSVTLIASGGITLNGAVTTSDGFGDAIVLAANSFTNNAGASALNPGAGRWLVWSSHPATDNRGGLVHGFKQYNADFGSTAVLGSGNGFLYSAAPTVTATLVGTASKVYDGTAAAALTAVNYAASGAIDGDTVTLNDPTSGVYADRNVGSGKVVSASSVAIAGATDGTGAAVYGYQLASTSASGNIGVITARPITVAAVSDTRVYDGTTGSAGSPLLGGGLGAGDSAGFVQAFDTRNAGTDKTLTASGAVNDGNGGNNYSVSFVANTTGTITQAALTGSITAGSKAYDGTTVATITGRALAGVVSGDDVTYAGGTANFDNRDAGTGKTVTAAGLGLAGTDSGNYTVNGTATTTASVTARPITVTAASDAKVYDATTASAAGPTITAGSLVGGDTAAFVQVFDNKNVGTGKALTSSGTVNDGNAGNNYAVTYVASSAGTITPATLTYAANTASRERGDPNPVLSGALTGFVGGETLATATTGALGFLTPASQSSLEGQYAVDGAGLTANNGNYVFVQAPGNATALTVSPPVNFAWTSAVGGAWEAGSNWNKGFAPVNGAVVAIPDLTGSVTYSSASGVTSVKSVTSLEGLTVAGGTLNLGASPADVSSFPALTLSGGTLGGSGTLNVPSLDMNGGTLTGGLQIAANVSNMAGTITPGSSPGSLVVNGNYMQGPNGTLLMEIAGPGTAQYDRLIVNGNATLGGTLRVNLLGGYAPADGETFTFVQSAGTVSGTFANTAFPSNPSFNAGYLPASMFVAVSGAAVPPPAAVASASQVLIAITDQNQNTLVASQVTGLPVEVHDQQQQQERQALQKKPMCNASNGSGGGGGGLMGGGGFRCNTRGCF